MLEDVGNAGVASLAELFYDLIFVAGMYRVCSTFLRKNVKSNFYALLFFSSPRGEFAFVVDFCLCASFLPPPCVLFLQMGLLMGDLLTHEDKGEEWYEVMLLFMIMWLTWHHANMFLARFKLEKVWSIMLYMMMVSLVYVAGPSIKKCECARHDHVFEGV